MHFFAHSHHRMLLLVVSLALSTARTNASESLRVVSLPKGAHHDIARFAIINQSSAPVDLTLDGADQGVLPQHVAVCVSRQSLPPGSVAVLTAWFRDGAMRPIRLTETTLLDPAPSENVRSLEGVGFSADYTSVFAYCRGSHPGVVAAAHLTCHVNGQVTEVLAHASLPTRDDGEIAILRIDTPTDLHSNDEILIEITDGESRWRWAGRMWAPFFLTPNQFSYPLRAVEVEYRGTRAFLKMYNESKRPIVIEKIAVDGDGATAQHDGSPFPILSPDQNFVDRDARVFDLGPHSPGHHDCVVEFHHAPALGHLSGEAAVRRQLSFTLDTSISLPVGGNEGPILPGCIALCHDGLHPEAPATRIWRLAGAIGMASPDWPLYAHMSSNASIDRVALIAPSCEFLVVSTPLIERTDNGTINWFETLADVGSLTEGRYVASLSDTSTKRLSPEEFQWQALVALGSGSKGITYRAWDGEAGTDGDVETEVLAELAKLEPYMVNSLPVELRLRSGTPGIQVQGLLSDTHAVLVLVNEWSTPTLGQRNVPFYAMPRSHVTLEWDSGADVTISSMHDVLGSDDVSWTVREGVCHIDVPPFSVGCVLIAEFNAGKKAVVAATAPTTHRDPERADVHPLSTPFVFAGRVQRGEAIDVPILIRNDGDSQVTVKSAGAKGRSDSLWFGETSIPAHATKQVTGRLVAGGARAMHVADRALVNARDEKLLFKVYVGYDTSRSVDVSPSRLRWPNRRVHQPRSLRLIGIEAANSVIAQVSADRSTISWRISQDGRAIDVKPTGAAMGALSGRIRLTIETGSEPRRQEVTVPYSIDAQQEYVMTPRELVVLQGRRSHRAIQIRNAFDEPFRVEATVRPESSAQVSVDGGFATAHELTVDVAIGDVTKPTQIDLLCLSRDQRQTRLSIPIRTVVMQRRGRASPFRDANVKVSDDRFANLDRVVGRVRANDGRVAAPWVRAHLLLTHPVIDKLPCCNDERSVESIVLAPDGRGWTDAYELRRGLPFPRRTTRPFVLQDHADQYLHALSIAGVSLHTPIVLIDDKWFTVGDLLSNSMDEAGVAEDQSWRVSAYAYYLDIDATWQNKFGVRVTVLELIRSLIREESKTCAGSHRLFALGRTLHLYRDDPRLPAELRDRIEEELALGLGTLNTSVDLEPVRGGKSGELTRLIVIGHTLEWLSVSMPRSSLEEPWMLRLVDTVIEALDREVDGQKEAIWWGAASHAVSGLVRWRDRLSTR